MGNQTQAVVLEVLLLRINLNLVQKFRKIFIAFLACYALLTLPAQVRGHRVNAIGFGVVLFVVKILLYFVCFYHYLALHAFRINYITKNVSYSY